MLTKVAYVMQMAYVCHSRQRKRNMQGILGYGDQLTSDQSMQHKRLPLPNPEVNSPKAVSAEKGRVPPSTLDSRDFC